MESIKSTYTIIPILTFLVTLIGCNVMEINQLMAKDSKSQEAPLRQQNRKSETISVLYENAPDTPLFITAASVQISEPQEVILTGVRGLDEKVTLVGKDGKARKITFTLQMVNQSRRILNQFILKIHNSKLFPDEYILLSSDFYRLRDNFKVNPKVSFTFTKSFYLSDKMNGLELMNHLSDFRVKIVESLFESGEKREWLEGGKYSNLYRYVQDITRVTDCKEHKEYEIVKNSSPPEQIAPTPGQKPETRLTAVARESACPPVSSVDIDRQMMNYQIERGTIYPMSESLRPTIVYKERPEYTVRARANKIQGVVVLNAVFADDRTLKAIKVVRGLPAGLTEKAIKAASRLGFEPAKKDGVPVSVRGDIEFSFSLAN